MVMGMTVTDSEDDRSLTPPPMKYWQRSYITLHPLSSPNLHAFHDEELIPPMSRMSLLDTLSPMSGRSPSRLQLPPLRTLVFI